MSTLSTSNIIDHLLIGQSYWLRRLGSGLTGNARWFIPTQKEELSLIPFPVGGSQSEGRLSSIYIFKSGLWQVPTDSFHHPLENNRFLKNFSLLDPTPLDDRESFRLDPPRVIQRRDIKKIRFDDKKKLFSVETDLGAVFSKNIFLGCSFETLEQWADIRTKSLGETGGVVQLLYTHPNESFHHLQGIGALRLHSEAGETEPRHAWGFMSSSGESSVWSVFLLDHEASDNHEVLKKIRRIRQAIEKNFLGGYGVSSPKVIFSKLGVDSWKMVGTPPEGFYFLPDQLDLSSQEAFFQKAVRAFEQVKTQPMVELPNSLNEMQHL